MTLLRHFRSRRRIIRSYLIFELVSTVGFLGLYWRLAEPLGIFLVPMAILTVFTFWDIRGLRKDAGFLCELTESEIRCVCPNPRRGDSFDIKLEDITAVKWSDSGGEGPDRYELVTRDGGCWWLTADFGNPSSEFIRKLCELRPDLDFPGEAIKLRIPLFGKKASRR